MTSLNVVVFEKNDPLIGRRTNRKSQVILAAIVSSFVIVALVGVLVSTHQKSTSEAPSSKQSANTPSVNDAPRGRETNNLPSQSNAPASSDPTNAPISKPSSNLYYGIPVQDYVLGKFDPKTIEQFITASFFPVKASNPLLRKDTADALDKLFLAFNTDYPNLNVSYLSATRSFRTQKGIWDYKWDNDPRYKDLPDSQKPLGILEYSSMPGTSRHHWGTDMDIYSLEPEDFVDGPGAIFYQWMLGNAARFGFCNPFNAGRSQGYREERWHWSYMPVSSILIKDWLSLYSSGRFGTSVDFKGSSSVSDLAEVYVKNINPSCLNWINK
jgi:LAS superfamily LD-carboxypeptidase LdcB